MKIKNKEDMLKLLTENNIKFEEKHWVFEGLIHKAVKIFTVNKKMFFIAILDKEERILEIQKVFNENDGLDKKLLEVLKRNSKRVC